MPLHSEAPQQNSRCRSAFLHVSWGISVAHIAQQLGSPSAPSAAAADGVAAFVGGAAFAAPFVGVSPLAAPFVGVSPFLAGSGASPSVLLFLRDRWRKRMAKTNATSKTANPPKPDSDGNSDSNSDGNSDASVSSAAAAAAASVGSSLIA